MKWTELENSVAHYIEISKRTSDSQERHKIGIIQDLMKAFEFHEKNMQADISRFQSKLDTYGHSYFMKWYDEHVKNSVQHEIAGVIIKMAIFTKNFNVVSYKDLDTDICDTTIKSIHVFLIKTLYDDMDLNGNGLSTVLLSRVLNMAAFYGIRDIEPYIIKRLQYATLKIVYRRKH